MRAEQSPLLRADHGPLDGLTRRHPNPALDIDADTRDVTGAGGHGGRVAPRMRNTPDNPLHPNRLPRPPNPNHPRPLWGPISPRKTPPTTPHQLRHSIRR